MLIIKPQKTVLIKHLIITVMNIKSPTPPLLPFLQNECNNTSFHSHTQRKRTSHCSEERRRVVFPGSFSKSYSPSSVNGSVEYLMLNTTVKSCTKQPFLHSLTQPLRSGKKIKTNTPPPSNKTQKARKAGFSIPEHIPKVKLLFKPYSNKMHSVFPGILSTPVSSPRQNNNDTSVAAVVVVLINERFIFYSVPSSSACDEDQRRRGYLESKSYRFCHKLQILQPTIYDCHNKLLT